MNYARVKDGAVQVGLPLSGYLSNGESVSNYNLLPAEVLKAEGWLPLVENIPSYNPVTEYSSIHSYTILSDRIIANYEILSFGGNEV